MVRIAPTYNGGVSRTFSKFRYNNMKSAYRAAVKFRDEYLAKFKKEYDLRFYTGKSPSSHWCETTYFNPDASKPLGGYWVNAIVGSIVRKRKGRVIIRLNKQWSIPKWGYKQAVANAEEWIKEMYKLHKLDKK